MKFKKRREFTTSEEYIDEVKFTVLKYISESSGFSNRPF